MTPNYSNAETRITLAVMLCCRENGRATFRDVAEVSGYTLSRVYSVAIRLRQDGLVAWDDKRAGTLRTLVRPVPIAVAS